MIPDYNIHSMPYIYNGISSNTFMSKMNLVETVLTLGSFPFNHKFITLHSLISITYFKDFLFSLFHNSSFPYFPFCSSLHSKSYWSDQQSTTDRRSGFVCSSFSITFIHFFTSLPSSKFLHIISFIHFIHSPLHNHHLYITKLGKLQDLSRSRGLEPWTNKEQLEDKNRGPKRRLACNPLRDTRTVGLLH